MIMIVKTPGSQMGSPAAAEEGGEEMGGGRWESGERSEVQARLTLTSTAPKARSRSREVATLDEGPRWPHLELPSSFGKVRQFSPALETRLRQVPKPT